MQAVSPGVNNTNLDPESALTTTAGFTLRNLPFEGLNVSVDFYRIDLRDTIGKLGAQAISTVASPAEPRPGCNRTPPPAP